MIYISGLLNISFLEFVGSKYIATILILTSLLGLMALCIAYLLTRLRARNIKERAEIEHRRMLEIHKKEAIEYVARKDPGYIDTKLQLRNYEEQLHRLESDLIELRELLFADRETGLRIQGASRKPRIFIVHGHDEKTKLELKNYLQNTLKLGEPVILHEQPNLGRTIIEKLEEETVSIDIVFVILTPDDASADTSWSDDQKRRARQNVIFELGYFYGKMTRRSGKIVLCHKGVIELLSDLSGIIYIDISAGISAVGEKIRLELQEWLQE